MPYNGMYNVFGGTANKRALNLHWCHSTARMSQGQAIFAFICQKEQFLKAEININATLFAFIHTCAL